MSREEMNKYAYELMIKNNPDEVIKNLMLLGQLQQRIDKAIEYIKSYHNTDLCECDKENLLNILRGEDNEQSIKTNI